MNRRQFLGSAIGVYSAGTIFDSPAIPLQADVCPRIEVKDGFVSMQDSTGITLIHKKKVVRFSWEEVMFFCSSVRQAMDNIIKRDGKIAEP